MNVELARQAIEKFNISDDQAQYITMAASAAAQKAIKVKNTNSYELNKGSVPNMSEYFKQQGFGGFLGNNVSKTSKIAQGQTVYKVKSDINSNLRKGDQVYLDGQHKNHLEVSDSRGKIKFVLNLDGSVNQKKTQQARSQRGKI